MNLNKPESDHVELPSGPRTRLSSMSQRLNRDLMAMEESFALNPADRQALVLSAKAGRQHRADLFSTWAKRIGKEQKSPVGLLNWR